MRRSCLLPLLLLSTILLTPPAAARAQNAPVPAAELLQQLDQHGAAMVRSLRAVCQQPDDAQAAALLDQLLQEQSPVARRLAAQSAALLPAVRAQLTTQMQQQAWIRDFGALVATGALTQLEQRALRHAALGAAYARFTEAGTLGRTQHSGPLGSAPAR